MERRIKSHNIVATILFMLILSSMLYLLHTKKDNIKNPVKKFITK